MTKEQISSKPPEHPPKKTYPTVWGDISFDELYHQTCRIVAYKLQKSGLNNPQDIDDAMQAAYLKVWQKLEIQPQMFAEKSTSYVVRFTYFQTKVQRFSQLRHNSKLVYSMETELLGTDILSIEQLETWIDLQAAIVGVAQRVEATPYALMALYSLITQVEVVEVIKILGCSSKTMTKYRNRLREQLVQHLPHYRLQNPEISPSFNLVSVSIVNTLLGNLL
jgi:DNA-directed RNA polymerase specialized sigma24 family protein